MAGAVFALTCGRPKASLVRPRLAHATACASAIELQRDCGRGLSHLSARVEEGDVCVYQVGTWQVDWSEAGPGAPPRLLLVRVDCMQLNWTHEHEHGLIHATAISEVDGSTRPQVVVTTCMNGPYQHKP